VANGKIQLLFKITQPYPKPNSTLTKVHTAVSRAVEYLELNTGVKFTSKDAVLHACLHFEALTDHEYNYSCVTCGDHPAVVIMDLHKKGAFYLLSKNMSA